MKKVKGGFIIMKFKNFFAGVAACAMAASAMVMTVSAQEYTYERNKDGGAPFMYVGLTNGSDYAKVDSVTAEVSVASKYLEGAIGYDKNGNWIGSLTKQTVSAETGEIKLSGIGGIERNLQVQFWWIGEGADKVTVTNLSIKDASGNELPYAVYKTEKELQDADDAAFAAVQTTAAETTAAETTAAAATTTTAAATTTKAAATTTTAKNSTNPPTGDAGIALAVTTAMAAAGVAVTFKKRK